MATFVLLHGAWAGGWCWSDVRRRLLDGGHDVVTPTLTGQGERVHLASPEVGVDTHVRDLVAVFDYEALDDVVLVAHSYAGTVATAAAAELGSRMSRLVYVDAFVPDDGETTMGLFPVELRELLRSAAHDRGDGWRIPGGEDILDIWSVTDPHLRAWIRPRLTPFPLRSFEQPVRLPAEPAPGVPRTYVSCIESPTVEVFARFVLRARREGWDHHELRAGHAAWATAAGPLADVLLRLPEAGLPSFAPAPERTRDVVHH